MSDVLRQKLKQADILVLKEAALAERRQEALEEQAKLEPRIDLLATRTRELQRLVRPASPSLAGQPYRLVRPASPSLVEAYIVHVMQSDFF